MSWCSTRFRFSKGIGPPNHSRRFKNLLSLPNPNGVIYTYPLTLILTFEKYVESLFIYEIYQSIDKILMIALYEKKIRIFTADNNIISVNTYADGNPHTIQIQLQSTGLTVFLDGGSAMGGETLTSNNAETATQIDIVPNYITSFSNWIDTILVTEGLVDPTTIKSITQGGITGLLFPTTQAIQVSGNMNLPCISNSIAITTPTPNTQWAISLPQGGNIQFSQTAGTGNATVTGLQNSTSGYASIPIDVKAVNAPQVMGENTTASTQALSITSSQNSVTIPSANQSVILTNTPNCGTWSYSGGSLINAQVSPGSGASGSAAYFSSTGGTPSGNAVFDANYPYGTANAAPTISIPIVAGSCPNYTTQPRTVNVSGNSSYNGNVYTPSGNLTWDSASSQWTMPIPAVGTGNLYSVVALTSGGIICDSTQFNWQAPTKNNQIQITYYFNGGGIVSVYYNTLPLNWLPLGTITPITSGVTGNITFS